MSGYHMENKDGTEEYVRIKDRRGFFGGDAACFGNRLVCVGNIIVHFLININNVVPIRRYRGDDNDIELDEVRGFLILILKIWKSRMSEKR